MPDRHRPDRQIGIRNAVQVTELPDQRGRYSEEQRAETFVDGGQQHQQRYEAGIAMRR